MLWILFVALLLATLTCSTSICVNERREKSGQEYFEQGELLIGHDQAKDALPFFRTAVRLCPDIGLYWQRLGEIELFLGHVDKARRRFQKAVTLSDVDIDKLQEYLQSHSTDSTSTPSFNEYPSIKERSIDETAFQSSLLTPFVVRNAFPLETVHHLGDLSSLSAHHGDEEVEFYPQNMCTRPDKVYRVKMSEALNYLDFPDGAYVSSDASEEGTYIQWNINSSRVDYLINSGAIALPSIISPFHDHLEQFLAASNANNPALRESFARKAHWYMLLIGESQAGMFLHTDNLPVGSWQMQLAGEKLWVVCSSRPVSLQDRCENAMNGVCIVEDSCQQTVLHPGDIFFYPPDTWHQTTCLSTTTISFSGTVVTNSTALLKSLRSECTTNNFGFGFDKTLCNLISLH